MSVHSTQRKFACPNCRTGLRVKSVTPVGSKVKCPKCFNRFTVTDIDSGLYDVIPVIPEGPHSPYGDLRSTTGETTETMRRGSYSATRPSKSRAASPSSRSMRRPVMCLGLLTVLLSVVAAFVSRPSFQSIRHYLLGSRSSAKSLSVAEDSSVDDVKVFARTDRPVSRRSDDPRAVDEDHSRHSSDAQDH